MRYLVLCYLLLASPACTPAPDTDQAQDAPGTYRTTQPSLLYFKNMRSSNYQQEEQKGTRITLYTHNRLQKQQSDSLGFIPLIASDWLNDRAFLLPTWAGEHIQPSSPLTVSYGSDSLVVRGADPMAQTDWLLAVHDAMRAGQQLYLATKQQDPYPFLRDKRLQTTFTTVVNDYLRLTERQ